MLRTGLLGRLCGLAGRNTAGQNWRGLGTNRRFFSSNAEDQDPPGEPEIIEDDPEAAQKFIKTKPAEYQFYKKNIAIVIENPLFPYSNTVVHLGKYQAKLLGQKMPSFVTCILRKELESSLEMSIDDDRKNQSMVGRDSTKEFVGVGTYCSVEFNKEYPAKIVQRLQGIHKVEVKSVAEYVMNMEAGADNQNLSDIVDELGQEEHETTVPATPKDPSKYMEQFVRQSIKAMRNQRSNKNSLQMEDSKFYITEVERLYNQRVHLEMEDRVKLEHMIDLSKKIMTIQGMPFMQETPLNFSDIELYLDLYGSFLARSQFFSREEMIEAFQERNVVERLNVVHSLMKKYYMMMGNYSYVGQEAQKNINNRQTRAFYNEVFDVVKTLSEGGQKGQKLITKLKETLSSKKPPVHVVEIFNEQIKRLSGANHESSDVNSVKAYLEWLVSMPYGIKSQDNLDIKDVKDKLNQDHFGLDEVKDRILEFVAVGKLKNTIKDKILLLHGPPGVGKTSLAESIARALGRQSERISLGGESDSTVLKGHRRTYMGSYPGKIVSALKKCGTENCVIILDEIDKLGRSNYHGDPQSNLLEILDPSQNKAFVDNYMDFPIDLSNVLFICTANTLNTISAPLLDRMDVISLSSYTGVEKKQILQTHLLPRAIHDCGLEESKNLFSITPEVEDILINDYCREPGVRSLERHAKKIMDKIAYEIVVGREQSPDATPTPIHVTKENLNKFVGNAIFDQEKLYTQLEPGVVIGLAYTQYGGAILFLEAKKYTFSRNTTNPGIKITGSLGDVMSESMRLAYTYARNHLHQLGNNFLETNDVHIHAPEGATPKDGPSAGITIASALVSLATNTPIKAGIGMTGELSLNGRVMKIGGVKEKTLAGKREGLKELIFPKDNEEDVKELKDYIKEGLNFHFVSTFEEAKPILFPNQASN